MPRVLIIDDDDAVRNALRKILERDGYDVAEAADGEAGLAQFQTRAAQVVLTDMYMPKMDGIDVIVRFREAYPDVSIVAISGGQFQEKGQVLRNATALGAIRTIQKPFTREEVLQTVEEAFER